MAAYDGKVVVVTGASQGIGKALCRELAPQRPRLVLAARDASALEGVAAECRARGAETLVVPTDVSEEAACRALVEATVARFGGVDVLVNNAGMGMLARFEDVTDLSLYERLMRVNYLGSVYPTFYALPHLRRANHRWSGPAGRISCRLARRPFAQRFLPGRGRGLRVPAAPGHHLS